MVRPGQTSALARALACEWFGFHGRRLAALFDDENRLAALQERWYGYHEEWLIHGAAAATLALLAGEEVYRHLAILPRFERRIANILHVIELLSTAEKEENLGPGQAIEWLLARRGEENSDGEERELRLESDRDAVRVVTMHAAKGLEFPVVFCPSLWRGGQSGRNGRTGAAKNDDDLAVCHDGSQAVFDLGSDNFDQARAWSDDEERAEELRLLYVALTRAKLQYVVFWPLVAGGQQEAAISRSPFCYLLAADDGDPVSAEAMRRIFLERGQAEGLAVEEVADGKDSPIPGAPPRGTKDVDTGDVFAARTFHRHFDWSWQVASFSSLTRRLDDDGNAQATLTTETEEKEPEEAATTTLPLLPNLPNLPRGPGFGKLLHTCLDQIDFTAPEEDIFALGQRLSKRQAALYGFAANAEDIARLLTATLLTPLPAIIDDPALGGWRLADLTAGDLVKEMPWSFALKKIWPEEISAILKDDVCVRPLFGPQASGYLTGFIDLLCRRQGKYYIIDYKSNFLGPQQSDYDTGSLTQAMAEHNYGLQYWLYTLAVDRWLAWQQQDYDYDRDFGGVYYLFVRGMRPDLPGAGVFATRPKRATLQSLAALLGEAR
jgi:exodeoxyribonuclease V beta subunit